MRMTSKQCLLRNWWHMRRAFSISLTMKRRCRDWLKSLRLYHRMNMNPSFMTTRHSMKRRLSSRCSEESGVKTRVFVLFSTRDSFTSRLCKKTTNNSIILHQWLKTRWKTFSATFPTIGLAQASTLPNKAKVWLKFSKSTVLYTLEQLLVK